MSESKSNFNESLSIGFDGLCTKEEPTNQYDLFPNIKEEEVDEHTIDKTKQKTKANKKQPFS